jgi:hypothetical protein
MSPRHYRQIVTLSPEARERTFLLKKYPEPGDDGDTVVDPIGGSLDNYNQTFLEIGEELGRALPEIVKFIDDKKASDKSNE